MASKKHRPSESCEETWDVTKVRLSTLTTSIYIFTIGLYQYNNESKINFKKEEVNSFYLHMSRSFM